MSERIRLEIKDGIAWVTMTRGDKYNALDWDMLNAHVDAAKQIRKDNSVRAVILQGEGKAFCAGLDFPKMTKQPDKLVRGFLKYGVKSTNLFQEVAWCWRKLPVPVIAVPHGYCYGGGLQIALAADFRFTTADCEFSVMEMKWGLIPDMTGTVTLRELVPMDVAKELTMTARVFKGDEAKELGLVTAISEDPLTQAVALAEHIKTRSPDAIAATKALFHRTWVQKESDAFANESNIQRKLLMGKNQRIVVKANFAKKAAKFLPRTFNDS